MAAKQLQGRFHKNVKVVQHRRSQFFLFPHKHADIQIYRNFRQQIEAYTGHSPVAVKAAKVLCNTNTSRGQTGGGKVLRSSGIGKN